MGAKILITGKSNCGKCQSIHTPTPTPLGWRQLGDIKVGDEVFNEHGLPVKVIGVYPQGLKSSYKINFTDGVSTNSCDEHLWNVSYISHGKYKYETLPLSTIINKMAKSLSSTYRFSIPISKEVNYEQKDLPIHPYVLGALIGDGSLTSPNMVLTSSIEDLWVQNTVQHLCPLEWTMPPKQKTNSNVLRSTLKRQSYITKYIKEVGLNVMSRNRFIPSLYLQGSVEQRKQLLAGLLDTDGSHSAKHNYTSFSTKSIVLAQNINELVLSLGGTGSVKYHKRKEEIEYHVRISTPFNPFLLPRKQVKWQIKVRNGITRKIKSIEQVQDCEQVCIKVDSPNELYLTEYFIVTHNTSLLKPLKEVFVVSRDGKPFSLELPHVNIPNFETDSGRPNFTCKQLLDLIEEKLETYKKKYKEYPKTIVFDSVSRIATDFETTCQDKYNGFDVWSNLNKEMNKFVQATNDILNVGMNVILIAHAIFDIETRQLTETCKGSFAKTGGFLSTVDYAINIDIVGSKRIVTHRGMHLSRTLLEGIPDKEDVSTFNLQTYIDKVCDKTEVVQEKWSL